MDQKFYRTGEFAKRACVSVRTLRYYDNKGLLSPTLHNESGYRLYSDEDFVKLQHILALKFLGFPLEQIKSLLETGPKLLQDVLGRQKEMLQAKQLHLGRIIKALEQTEMLLQANPQDYASIIRMIRVMQMEPAWMNKYLSPEQREYMRELAKKSYDAETLHKLAARGWTEEDQKSHVERYTLFRSELKKLVEAGADPGSPEAQAVAEMLREMNDRRAQGDPKILEGMRKTWENYNNTPDERKPQQYQLSEAERNFIKEAMTILYRNRT